MNLAHTDLTALDIITESGRKFTEAPLLVCRPPRMTRKTTGRRYYSSYDRQQLALWDAQARATNGFPAAPASRHRGGRPRQQRLLADAAPGLYRPPQGFLINHDTTYTFSRNFEWTHSAKGIERARKKPRKSGRRREEAETTGPVEPEGPSGAEETSWSAWAPIGDEEAVPPSNDGDWYDEEHERSESTGRGGGITLDLAGDEMDDATVDVDDADADADTTNAPSDGIPSHSRAQTAGSSNKRYQSSVRDQSVFCLAPWLILSATGRPDVSLAPTTGPISWSNTGSRGSSTKPCVLYLPAQMDLCSGYD